MSIAQYATRSVIMISEKETAFDAAQLMKKENVGAVVVVKNKETDLSPVGILTDREIVTRFLAEGEDPRNMKISDL